jgi:hypothetical protein
MTADPGETPLQQSLQQAEACSRFIADLLAGRAAQAQADTAETEAESS